jgi:hypothetical protein
LPQLPGTRAPFPTSVVASAHVALGREGAPPEPLPDPLLALATSGVAPLFDEQAAGRRASARSAAATFVRRMEGSVMERPSAGNPFDPVALRFTP